LINQLAFNGMLIASVSTILFNANPLLRYDGYYILSDLLEIPNLRQKANEYTLGLVKRHIFRVKLPQPLPAPMQRFWSVLYAIAAAIYRVFIGIVIALVVTYTVPVLGILMAIGVVITFFFLPMFKLVKYLAIEPELHRKRSRAIGFCASVAAVVIFLIGGLKFSIYVYGEGELQPRQRQELYVRTSGFVTEIAAREGQLLQKGDIILRATNERLELEIAQLEQQIAGVRAAVRQALATDDVQRQIHEEHLAALQEQLDRRRQEFDDLTIRAPFTGRLIAPHITDLHGQYLRKEEGRPIATVATLDEMIIRAVVDQRDYLLAVQKTDPHPQVRLAGLVSKVLRGRDTQVINAAQYELPSHAVTHHGGGPVALDTRDSQGLRARTPQHQIHVILDNPHGVYIAGQRAYIRWEVERNSLMWNWQRRFWQLVRTHSSDRWL
jgi:putative peptide zinc metalloprotease protein